MKIPLYQIDAFTSELFKGNPAAVCPLREWLPDKLMQQIALENNLSETAFFVRRESDGAFELRWFTPTDEVDLCGHATLASAFVLYNFLGYTEERVRFITQKSGELRVERDGARLALDFPALRTEPAAASPELLEGLGGRAPVELRRQRDYVAVYSSEEEVKALTPDFRALTRIDAQGVIVTARGREVDFVSRYFAPRVGVDEDPATGSAHSMLIPFWAERLSKTRLTARQVSARGGELFCEHRGARVRIAGHAVPYLTGEIHLPD